MVSSQGPESLSPLFYLGVMGLLLAIGLSLLAWPKRVQELSIAWARMFRRLIGFYPFSRFIERPAYLWNVRLVGALFLVFFIVVLGTFLSRGP